MPKITGKAVLDYLVANSGAQWLELCGEFSSPNDANFMELLFCVQNLAEIDLVTVDGVNKERIPRFLERCTGFRRRANGEADRSPRIRASSRWPKIQYGLENDFRTSGWGRNRHLEDPFWASVKPWFGAPREAYKPMEVFIASPLTEPFETIYRNHIQGKVRELGMSCGRASDVFSATPIMHDIWSLIFSSNVVVADCTGRNPNVFYEMGIAHTLGKPVILLTQNKDDIPFDLRHIRYIHYHYTPPGMRQFEEALFNTIQESTEGQFLFS